MLRQSYLKTLLASVFALAAIGLSARQNISVIVSDDDSKAETVYFINESYCVYNNLKSTGYEAVDKYIASLVFGEKDATLDQAYSNFKSLWKKQGLDGNLKNHSVREIRLSASCIYTSDNGRFACFHVKGSLKGSAPLSRVPKTADGDKMKAQYICLANGIDRGFIIDTQKKQVMEIDDIFQPAVATKLKGIFGNDVSIYAEDRCLQLLSPKGDGRFIFSSVTEQNFTDYFKQVVDWQQLASSTIHTPKFLRGQTGIEDYLQKGGLQLAGDNDTNCATVVVSLIVNEDGSVMQPHVEQKSSDNFDEAQLIALCGKMPKWMPAYENGKPVVREATFTVRLKEKVYDVVEQMPSFPGGINAMMKYLSQNIKYPKTCQENGIQGRVIVSFVVERDGSLSNINIKKSVHPLLDKEAVRLVQSMPKWEPGRQNGKLYRVQYLIPVTFWLK